MRRVTFDTWCSPKTLEEAYELACQAKSVVLGGGIWLKQSKKHYHQAIDLSQLGLNEIEETSESITIGAMATLREIECHPIIQSYMKGVLAQTVSKIMGITLRNGATIGGSVMAHLGFSDLLMPLLSLDATLVFYHRGQVSLESFLTTSNKEADLLLAIVLKKDHGHTYYASMKKTALDFPVLGCAVTRIGHYYRVVVGARPASAIFAPKTMSYLVDYEDLTDDQLAHACDLLQEEISLGEDTRASKAYRRLLLKELFMICMEEVALR